jgi:hypothetical protein
LYSDRDCYERWARSATVPRLGSCVSIACEARPMTGIHARDVRSIPSGNASEPAGSPGSVRPGASRTQLRAPAPVRRFGHGRGCQWCLRETSNAGTRWVLVLPSHWRSVYVPLACSVKDDKRPSFKYRFRANPSRGGDAKPGISEPRPPGCRHRSATTNGEVSREGETDALHHRNRAAGNDGNEPRRRDALVGLKMYSTDPAFGPCSGHRWH